MGRGWGCVSAGRGGDSWESRRHFDSRPPVITANPKSRRRRVFLIGQSADRHIPFQHRHRRLENSPQPVEITLAERIVLMVVALGTANLQSEKHGANGTRQLIHQAMAP